MRSSYEDSSYDDWCLISASDIYGTESETTGHDNADELTKRITIVDGSVWLGQYTCYTVL